MNDALNHKNVPATPETLADLMTRDLAAWREAKALIDRAKRS